MGQRELSAAELRTLHELEGRFAAQDPVLDAELRDGCPRPVTAAPGRVGALLVGGSTAIGVTAMLAGPGACLVVILLVLVVAVVSTAGWLWHRRRSCPAGPRPDVRPDPARPWVRSRVMGVLPAGFAPARGGGRSVVHVGSRAALWCGAADDRLSW